MSKLNNSQSSWLVYALLLLDVLKSPEYVTLNSWRWECIHLCLIVTMSVK